MITLTINLSQYSILGRVSSLIPPCKSSFLLSAKFLPQHLIPNWGKSINVYLVIYFLTFFLTDLYSQCGAWSHDPEFKNHVLYWLSYHQNTHRHLNKQQHLLPVSVVIHYYLTFLLESWSAIFPPANISKSHQACFLQVSFFSSHTLSLCLILSFPHPCPLTN